MPEIVQCPQCDRKLRVPDDLLGKKVKCPTCSTMFVAEVGGATSSPGSAEDKPWPPPDEAPPRITKQPSSSSGRRRARDDDDEDDDGPLAPRRGRGPRRDSTPHRGTLILVLGILSIVIGGLGIGLIMGPIAWVMGSSDLKEIRAGRMDSAGESQTNAGMICGIIGTILGFIQVCCCGGVIFMAIMEEMG